MKAAMHQSNTTAGVAPPPPHSARIDKDHLIVSSLFATRQRTASSSSSGGETRVLLVVVSGDTYNGVLMAIFAPLPVMIVVSRSCVRDDGGEAQVHCFRGQERVAV